MKLLTLWLALACYLRATIAVKEYLFKNCAQSGFCQRNRHFAQRISDGAASPYEVDPASITTESHVVRGHILKRLPSLDPIRLPFELSLLIEDSVRFKVDEDRSNVPVGKIDTNRYNQTVNHVFDGPVGEKTLPIAEDNLETTQDSLTYKFGPDLNFEVSLQYSPLKLVLSRDSNEEVVFNDRQLFHMEHFRTKQNHHLHLDPQLELDFDTFSDSFKDSLAHTVPLGPEAVAADFTFPGVAHAYGIPEHADLLTLKDTTGSDWPYRLYNVDIFEYETDSRMPMYGSIPLLVGLKPESSVGVLWLNSADTFVDVKKSASFSTHWMSETGVIDFVIFVGETPQDINYKYGKLAGNVMLPQLFALGYHQSRWNYNDQKDVLEITAKMDEHLIPFDTIWLDVEYLDQKKYFKWGPETFPSPHEMLRELDSTGRNIVVLIDPHLKVDYEISDFTIKNGIAVNDRSGQTYKGHCWPGESVWIDAVNPHAQAYWDILHKLSADSFLGELTNIYIWNDMNEPSVFNEAETTFPRDNLHYGNVEHRSLKNLWGKAFHELTHHSLTKRLENVQRQRPFILTRSFFAGSQRTAAMWTGDNMAQWEYLKESIPMVLSLNVVNMPFSGADVGGFFGDPSTDLLTRWYQTGIWYPFFRAHAHIDSRRREPWVPGEPYTSIIREAVRLRYALLPTLYTAFYEASQIGAPIWKPMAYENHADVNAYGIDDQFFLGESGLLVKPVTQQDAREVEFFVPGAEVYYDYTNGEFAEHPKLDKTQKYSRPVLLEDIPILVKGGSIFARKDRYRRSSRLMKNDPYTLVVAFDKLQNAKGKLYVDDGESYEYQTGRSLLCTFTASAGNRIEGESRTGDKTWAASLENVLVEKVIIVGAQAVAEVLVEQNGRQWLNGFKQRGDVITVSNPKISLADKWSIELREAEAHDEL